MSGPPPRSRANDNDNNEPSNVNAGASGLSSNRVSSSIPVSGLRAATLVGLGSPSITLTSPLVRSFLASNTTDNTPQTQTSAGRESSIRREPTPATATIATNQNLNQVEMMQLGARVMASLLDMIFLFAFIESTRDIHGDFPSNTIDFFTGENGVVTRSSTDVSRGRSPQPSRAANGGDVSGPRGQVRSRAQPSINLNNVPSTPADHRVPASPPPSYTPNQAGSHPQQHREAPAYVRPDPWDSDDELPPLRPTRRPGNLSRPVRPPRAVSSPVVVALSRSSGGSENDVMPSLEPLELLSTSVGAGTAPAPTGNSESLHSSGPENDMPLQAIPPHTGNLPGAPRNRSLSVSPADAVYAAWSGPPPSIVSDDEDEDDMPSLEPVSARSEHVSSDDDIPPLEPISRPVVTPMPTTSASPASSSSHFIFSAATFPFSPNPSNPPSHQSRAPSAPVTSSSTVASSIPLPSSSPITFSTFSFSGRPTRPSLTRSVLSQGPSNNNAAGDDDSDGPPPLIPISARNRLPSRNIGAHQHAPDSPANRSHLGSSSNNIDIFEDEDDEDEDGEDEDEDEEDDYEEDDDYDDYGEDDYDSEWPPSDASEPDGPPPLEPLPSAIASGARVARPPAATAPSQDSHDEWVTEDEDEDEAESNRRRFDTALPFPGSHSTGSTPRHVHVPHAHLFHDGAHHTHLGLHPHHHHQPHHHHHHHHHHQHRNNNNTSPWPSDLDARAAALAYLMGPMLDAGPSPFGINVDRHGHPFLTFNPFEFLNNNMGVHQHSERPPDAGRARELIRGLEMVVPALLSRIEAIEAAGGGAGEGEAGNKEKEGGGCAVCWDPYSAAGPEIDGSGDDGSQVLVMPCLHVFHRGCLQPWFETHTTCPVCRFDIDPDSRTLRHDDPARRFLPSASRRRWKLPKGPKTLEQWIEEKEQRLGISRLGTLHVGIVKDDVGDVGDRLVPSIVELD